MSGPRAPVTLKDVVSTLGAPIQEEHAWALIFQSLTKMLEVTQEKMEAKCYLVKRLEELVITPDGEIHEDSFLRKEDNVARDEMTHLGAGIADLAVVVYDALEWELQLDGFARQLGQDLEDLITRMADGDDPEEQDEGIDLDEDEITFALCEDLFKSCKKHFSTVINPDEAKDHYRQVCKAMVATISDLSSMMSVIKTRRHSDLKELEMMEEKEWAGVFNMVMDELRTGVKLRKTTHEKSNIEFSMTPYEMLMDDIKSNKAVLKPPRRDLPEHVELAARDKIMNYIKSKPKLKPANERKLAELVIEETPVEKMMSDIRTGKARKSLRRSRRLSNSPLRLSGDQVACVKVNGKKLLVIDDDLQSSMLKFDSSPDNSADEVELDCSVFDSPPKSPILEESLNLQEFGSMRHKVVKAGLDRTGRFKEEELEEFITAARECVQCQETQFTWYRRPNCCFVCNHKVCNSCVTKMKFPKADPSEVPLSSLSLDSMEEASSSTLSDRFNFARRSLKVSPRRPEGPKFTRSKTLHKVEAKALQAKAATKETSSSQLKLTNETICLDCRTCLANLLPVGKKPRGSPSFTSAVGIHGKISPLGPSHKDIHQIQTKTIQKRRQEKPKHDIYLLPTY